MEFSSFPDTLVFKITRYTHEVNHIMYILYDISRDIYIIRGNKLTKKTYEKINYSFECMSINYLRDFILTTLHNNSEISYSYYNYDNLPLTTAEVTFDFLEDYDDKIYELSSETTILNKKELKNKLAMLKYILNNKM